jgi:hypothetical protein
MAQSEFRPGRSLISIGGPPAIALAAGATAQAVLQVREAGQLGQLCISVIDPATANDLTNSCQVTEITHNNDLLVSTTPTAAQFAETSLVSPLFGHVVQVNDELTVSVVNNSAIAGVYQVSFTTI